MKKKGILNAELSRAIASMGHGDKMVICDAGLPIPSNTIKIDLALCAGKPSFQEVLNAVLFELRIESAVLAEEIKLPATSDFHTKVIELLPIDQDALSFVSHQEFKQIVNQAKVVVRTGEFTPYANIILYSGVTF